MGVPFRLKISTLGAALVLAGCSLAPTYEQPQAPIPAEYPLVGASEAELAQADAEFNELGWEHFFNEPQLKELIDVALENNRESRIALARLLRWQTHLG